MIAATSGIGYMIVYAQRSFDTATIFLDIICLLVVGFLMDNILYTPSHRKSIAIEPITGAPNAFNIPELGLKILQPNEIIEGVFGIRKLFLKMTK